RENDPSRAPLQRIGLSATQRPLEEIARLLGGAEATANEADRPVSRPVKIVEAGRRKTMELTVEVPVEDMTQLAEPPVTGPASAGPKIPSIWPAIHPRLVELIRGHRSTMIFVNSRRLAERLATSINEVAEEEIALAHHGSIAKDTRLLIEDRLKRGVLPAIVATSSLELGIDMGAVDLVIQIEAPPTIASGIQRIGRAGHQVGAPSRGVVFPKYRGDLLACSAAVERMFDGMVEQTFYPRNPLDVLAQQLVAMVALEEKSVDELFAIVRSSAPFTELTRNLFDGVLDLLSGRYPSNEFAELRPRVNWDRVAGVVSPRRGTQRIAIANAGTIPDRGLYGVFLAAGDERTSMRVGELDEEMVFETRPGDVFLLGASSWRCIEITHDRVLVEPAPGEPGRMPFWRGDGPGRPLEFGQAIGKLARELVAMPSDEAKQKLQDAHALDSRAAANLLAYLREQADATTEVPSDSTIVVESFLDEVGDWRIVMLTPFGARLHAPWAMAVAAALREDIIGEVDLMWSDNGIVFRVPESDEPPPIESFFPAADQIEDIIVRELGGSALFASRFRENAARALLLPRRQSGQRTPLWLQRRKSADLLAVAANYERFPIMLETYRECLRDVFDLPGLKKVLQDVSRLTIRVRQVETKTPSPFAASLLFDYTANFLYNGDAPLAERRAATLALDHVQLRELLGDAELRELLDADVVDELSLELQRLDPRYVLRDADAVVDLLRRLGDLSRDEVKMRPFAEDVVADQAITQLIEQRRILELTIGGEMRLIAAEDAGCYRDALGVVPPPGIPDAFLEQVDAPLVELVGRYARTHIPFLPDAVAVRFGVGIAPVNSALDTLLKKDKLIEGEFLPGGRGREWTDVDVLRKLKQRSLAKLRKQIEPVEPDRFATFLLNWQGLVKPRRGLDGLLDAVEQLQGLALPFSEWESSVLPLRVHDFRPAQLDELFAAGELAWRGFGTIGTADGRIALYLADSAALLAPVPEPIEDETELQIMELLTDRGALFFDRIVTELGGFRNDVLEAVWRLVWAGHLTNDSLAPLRSLMRGAGSKKKKKSSSRRRHSFRSRRSTRTPGSEGRWTLWHHPNSLPPSSTERQTALATQLVERYGVLTREAVASEGIAGGFSGIYPVLKAMEEAGRVRRGYFVAGQGAAQFAAPGADDRLREPRDENEDRPLHIIGATDPANPHGAALRWPTGEEESSRRPQRVAGAHVILAGGELVGYLNRSGERLLTFVPEEEPRRTQVLGEIADALIAWKRTLYLKEVNGQSVAESTLATALLDRGFVAYHDGYQLRV
ncbi:MAG: helicase-related protein, partial [Planctomycetota bacterium]